MKKPWMHITKWTKPNWKDYILWFQLYNIQEKSKLWRQYKDKWLAGVGPGSMGSEITLYSSNKVDKTGAYKYIFNFLFTFFSSWDPYCV